MYSGSSAFHPICGVKCREAELPSLGAHEMWLSAPVPLKHTSAQAPHSCMERAHLACCGGPGCLPGSLPPWCSPSPGLLPSAYPLQTSILPPNLPKHLQVHNSLPPPHPKAGGWSIGTQFHPSTLASYPPGTRRALLFVFLCGPWSLMA